MATSGATPAAVGSIEVGLRYLPKGRWQASLVQGCRIWNCEMKKKLEKWKTISKSSVIVVSAFYGRVTDNLARRPSVHVNSVPLTRGWTLGSSINNIIFFKCTKEGGGGQKLEKNWHCIIVKKNDGMGEERAKRSRKIAVTSFMDSPSSCWKDQIDKPPFYSFFTVLLPHYAMHCCWCIRTSQ